MKLVWSRKILQGMSRDGVAAESGPPACRTRTVARAGDLRSTLNWHQLSRVPKLMPVKGRTLLYVSAFTNSNATRKEAVSLFPLASLRYVLYLEATNSAYGTVFI